MSSVIVLDSSDEEEVPAKKAFIAPSIPATITPIKTTTSKCPTTNQLKHKKNKQRPIPSGITITRRSPVDVGASPSNLNNNNSNILAGNPKPTAPNFNDTFVTATISAATLAATSKLNSLLSNKSGTTIGSSTLKANATTKERQTPTPPRQMSQHQQQQQGQKSQPQQMQTMQSATKQQAQHVSRQQQQQQPQVLPHLSQLPQLQPSPLVLSKRLTATSTTTTTMQQQQPPKLQKVKQQQNPPKLQAPHQQKQHSRQLSASPATLTPIKVGANHTIKTATSCATEPMLPMIASVQSMAASATPPLQLLATPPHSTSTTFSDQQLFSPKSMHTTCSLPPSTTVTAARPQMTSSGSTNIAKSSSNKNINDSFKIMLPPKSSNNITTPTSTPTPVALQQVTAGPRIAYVSSLAPQIQPNTNNNKTAKSNSMPKAKPPPTSTASPVPIAITASGAESTGSMVTSLAGAGSGLASVRRVKPTTLLRKNDEAWLNRTSSNANTAATTAAAAAATMAAAKKFYNDDLVMELLPHSSSTKTPIQKSAAAEFVKNMISRIPMQDTDADTDSAQMIIPNTLPTTSTKNSYSTSTQKAGQRKSYPVRIDLTESPEKSYTASSASTPKPTPSQPSVSLTKSKSIDRITNGDASTATSTGSTTPPPPSPLPLTSDYEELLRVCRAADTSADMEKLVKSKLPKYYYNVHPDFVRSKGFSKSLRTVITNIQKEPDLVYLHLKTIVDELKVRSKSKEVLADTAMLIKSEEPSDGVAVVERVSVGNGIVSGNGSAGSVGGASSGGVAAGGDEKVVDPISTGNKHTDEQIKKLNKALYILTKRIEVLESAEVDWEDEDSSYLQVERFKKRACQIYEKICDLTGESKNAHRLVKKPIHFNGTTYTQFNKTLQAYVNRTKEFPDYFDVLRMLEHCNRQYDYALANFEMKRIAHDAFIKIGKLLQSRRRTDLYETVTHFTAHEKDPATIDPALQAKLSENQKKRTRISDVIEKYAREQDMIREELKEARQAKVTSDLKSLSSDDNDDDDNEDGAITSSSARAAKVEVKQTQRKLKKDTGEASGKEIKHVIDLDGDDDDDDEEDEDEDEDEVNGSDLEADVEKLANGYLSDVESDVEIVIDTTTEEINSNELKDDKIKDKKDPLSVVDGITEFSTKTKLQSDQTLKTQKVVTNPQTTTSTQQEQLSNASMKDSTRQKTADSLAFAANANKSPTATINTNEKGDNKTATASTIANGCMKSVAQNERNAQAATTTQSSTIKVVSVTSLNNKANVVVDKEGAVMYDREQQQLQSSQSITMQTQKQSTIATTTTKESKRQRSMAEIVISDEES
ncbi:daxx-like protein [Eurosta solidaginis]|uniref:daxx-like protein n=1 Tax=Eurosta solidaginis TaxID=178769 RepID=UPI003530B0FA